MNNNYVTELKVKQSAATIFNAVNNVKGWWSMGVKEATSALNDEFVYRHKDMHYSKQKLIEVVPNQKVVWLVTDSHLSFLKNKTDEWTGTKVIFDISTHGDENILRITHEGLSPEIECFNACSGGWNYYLHNSLLPLIETGKGNPDREQ
ncbi:MAG: SRPBCC domain-containing protein [Bacteroidetes bacterium]|nr:SRPBCC domain-containing protein [Bacteroidota bacterium]